MAMILLHGVIATESATPLASSDGDLPQHRLLAAGALTAIVSSAVSDLTEPDLSPDTLAAAALTHDAILTAYAGVCDVVPIQFGTAFSDTDAVCTFLTDPDQVARVAATLQRLKGLQEFSLRLTVVGDPPDARLDSVAGPIAGRAFLQRRAGLRQVRRSLSHRRAALASQIAATVHAQAVGTQAGRPAPDRLCSIAILWPRDRLRDLTDLVAGIVPQAAALGLDLQLRGPFPAYSFGQDSLAPVDDVA
jgi:Gas vesicle synthesis protein GvpL/GvpF